MTENSYNKRRDYLRARRVATRCLEGRAARKLNSGCVICRSCDIGRAAAIKSGYPQGGQNLGQLHSPRPSAKGDARNVSKKNSGELDSEQLFEAKETARAQFEAFQDETSQYRGS